MPKTDFLKLEVTTDNETKFEQWRNAINGPDNSNAKKIDAFAENIHKRVEDKLNKIWEDITEQTTTNLTDILVFNRGSNVYKTTIANLLSQVDTQLYLVVSELPTTANPNKIYLVPSSDPKTQNTLDEFIWVDNAWEKIGAVSVDLSNYYTKSEVDGKITNLGVPNIKQDILDLESNKVDKVSGKGLSTNDFTNNDKNKLDGIEAGAEVNPYSKTQLDNMFDDKVDKVSGMGLSSNDFTTTEKNKLSGIQAGAQVNAVTTVAGRTGAVVLAKADVGLGSVQNYAIASKTEAEAGTVNTVYMTPLRTKEAITAAMGDIESALDAILGV